MARISITMAYYNRPDLLRRTLWAYFHLHPKTEDYEFVIVDDKSDPDLAAEPVVKELAGRLDIKLIYREHKIGVNPAIPVNISVRQATGEIIAITNPETLPLTPVVEQIRSIEADMAGTYAVAACYSISEPKQQIIASLDPTDSSFPRHILERVQMLSRRATCNGDDGWYEHPEHFPRALYFFAAMPKTDFVQMGGMDEDFRDGYAWEDTDFIGRLQRKDERLIALPNALVVHQHHYSSAASRQDAVAATQDNQQLLQRKMQSGGWVANEGRDWGQL